MAKTTKTVKNRTIKVEPVSGGVNVSAPVADLVTLCQSLGVSLQAWRRQNTHLVANRIVGQIAEELHDRLLSKLITRHLHDQRKSLKLATSEASAAWLVISSHPLSHELPGVSQIINRLHQIVQP